MSLGAASRPPDSFPVRRALAWSLGVVAIVALSACSKKEAAPVALRPVVAVAATADGKTTQSSLPATIEARYSTPLSFRVGGKIIERRVRLGDSVKAGEIVAKLDPADNAKSAASGAAQLSAAQHQLTYAEQQLVRDRAQAQENLIARAQLEQTENAYAAALAQRNQAQAQAALSADQLKYTTLVADKAGVITAEQADTGQNVSAGQAIYNLAWSGEIDVVSDVPETTLGSLTVGQKATATIAALGGKQFAARVREVSPAADAQSRTYRVRLTLEAPTPEVRLGMTADVAFAQAQAPASNASGASGPSDPSAQAFTLPATALFHADKLPAVWIVKADGSLELRRVEVSRYGERTVTVSQGITAGDRVVWQGVHTVSAGERVRVVAPLHPEDFAS
ncbi:efflux RND transporter periplasmic adaptor subunit [Caballeronia sp. SEWSISQ10-4 2]|uniref:efflux RND transporter periplasmic adaptor subunit n=1 Tax=Caballeronia sp. SEWSISQ10-4 2 TaxID=2937438 RepID=UPI0026521A64|nr:efflux RND transporter periplasmic adaptor subunit [Caballeronia sp. SEWSISQ10-4 2]MDN7184311.1 efflux RND transporter periplasmic adaptor subunit [Caballeronia sp. SEWSISQ10-4 2]